MKDAEIRADVRRIKLDNIERNLKAAMSSGDITLEDVQGVIDNMREESEAAAEEEKQRKVNDEFVRDVMSTKGGWNGFRDDERN